ncbi:hypothetical protein METHB2_480015 [Candidatus Methylobacter favarea]|uniref:Uncharacterized protein n=1 Tax=Candidatus Methylobacter favarea TaxID=2707345 RepID=A0A8S0XHB2_9GAMM|nr:hypothetical protein [Candidatus Methylobacter favarea]CAA9891681.1 hypothetical protein METHB2_480015 [Candidatus Methylobacter favarea]
MPNLLAVDNYRANLLKAKAARKPKTVIRPAKSWTVSKASGFIVSVNIARIAPAATAGVAAAYGDGNGQAMRIVRLRRNVGKHGWCGKPMALTVQECEAMLKACRDNKVKLAIGYRMQHEPNLQPSPTTRMRRTAPAGEPGVGDVLANVVLRPAGFIATVPGTSLYIIVLPATAINAIYPEHETFEDLAEIAIIRPAKFTFTRPLGVYSYPP